MPKEDTQFKVGNRGRPPGSKNKMAVELCQMVREALDLAGGSAYLLRQADENPTAFMALVGKIIPKELDAKVQAEMIVNWPLGKTELD